MGTKYAPSERETMEKIKVKFGFIKNIESIDKLVNSLPFLGAILNQQRQVVFANEMLLEIINLKKVEDVLGQRPGEVLRCINSKKEIGGCGTSKNCAVCGVVNCIIESQKTNKKIVTECRITGIKNNELIAYDFKVAATPFQWNNEMYYILSLIDISSDKRRKNLEKIFFHDVINKTGNLYGFIDLIKQETDTNKIKEFVEILDIINKDLIEEITSQRDLSAAESGELQLKLENQNSAEIISSCVNQIQYHDIAKSKYIFIDSNIVAIEFKTDGIMLKRILTNMLKNALEATPKGETVTIGCQSDIGGLNFWVSNTSCIPENAQLQIFQRSYSTKGLNRGLGTYSMKILGENYLKGKVGFESEENKGTRFFITLPL